MKKVNLEFEPCDFLNVFLRFWLFEPHFLIKSGILVPLGVKSAKCITVMTWTGQILVDTLKLIVLSTLANILKGIVERNITAEIEVVLVFDEKLPEATRIHLCLYEKQNKTIRIETQLRMHGYTFQGSLVWTTVINFDPNLNKPSS